MPEDTDRSPFVEKDPLTGLVLFKGTQTPVKAVFQALSANETVDSFCSRTGVPLHQALAALDIAGDHIPTAMADFEAFHVRMEELRNSIKETLNEKPKGLIFLSPWFQSVFTVAILLLMLGMGILVGARIYRTNKVDSQVPSPPVVQSPR